MKAATKLLILFFLVLSYGVQAQQDYKLDGKPSLKVTGTSTLHDWDMVSEEAKLTAKLNVANGEVQQISAAQIAMPAESIKSGKRPMDSNAYKALKTDKHKEVKFQLINANKEGGKWKINGTLELAGMKKPVTFDADVKTVGTKVSLQAETAFKLTSFGIEPPTAMLGSVKTGDDVRLTIQMTLTPAN